MSFFSCCANSGIKTRFHYRRSRSRSRNQERRAYDLVKTAFRFRLWSSENHIVGVGGRRGRTKPITKRGNLHYDWLILPLLLPTPRIWFSLNHKRNVSDGVLSGVGRNGNVLILPIPSHLWLRFLIFTRSQTLFTTPPTTPTRTRTPTPSLVKTSLKIEGTYTV